MPHPRQFVQPPLEFIPPDLDRNILRVARLILPVWMRRKTSIAKIDAVNVEQLAELYQQFQAGKIRLLLAFRHPSADDPFCLMYLVHYLLPRTARQTGIRLQSPTHAHFMYDRGIPLWAGAHIGWMYSKLGGTPIHRGKLDRVGLKSARDLLTNGQFPLMAAPEGATNGHNEIVSPLEPGIAQMAFWCVEDLQKADRSEQVVIVPIGIQYHYVKQDWKPVDQLLKSLEADTGIKPNTSDRYARLYAISEHMLTVMESFYRRFYHQDLPSVENAEPNARLALRLEILLDAALTVAEQYFNLQTKGNVIDRCRRLEQAAWDLIFREDLKLGEIPPVDRGLADRVAEEASLRIWHMRLVESFVAVTGKYVLEKPSLDRFAETTLLLWDMITRIKGGNAFKRPKLGKQSVLMTIGDPISVSDRAAVYQSSRRAAKQAVADLTQDLQIAMEKMIL
ncbi:1-acyl-sn-glycerol-3-phosphate acyltransferase [Leptolyngbya sp. DQ-M1]|uniref:1-acyl-sn-glycerol-3-phosphate acyltransferase n=1 Tax=Leptolyngbya sp. DQ-M1 TaxID=2933920 RepID=UPI0032979590